MAFSEDFLYQLRQNNPIESVMSSYTNPIRRGRNFVCLCPFHSEKTPSCTIYPETSSFYCFGCGTGGEVITFVRKIENLGYVEAIKFLAERSGMTMPEDSHDNDIFKIKARIYEINRTAAKFFHSQLKTPAGEKGRRYFLGRGLTVATIQKYGLGYAIESWDCLKNYLIHEGFSEDEMVAAGVCGKSDNGRVYDLFRDRAIFPIIDLRGNVIGFGGRILDGQGPKYLNTGDTPVFKKSRNLFSLNFAKAAAHEKLILAEGYMDVIAINQAGFENVVATLGTSLTSEQSRLMAQYAKEIIIAYDSDIAGQAATHKAINLLSEVGVGTRIIKMEDAKDPDEYIKKFGAVRFKLLLDNSEGAINFELEKCKAGIDLETEQGKIKYLNLAIKVLMDINSTVEREIYISKIANEFGISKDVIREQVKSYIRKRENVARRQNWTNITKSMNSRDEINPEARDFPRESKAEEGIIRYLLLNPENIEFIASSLSADDWVTAFHRKIYEVLSNKSLNSEEFSISSLGEEFSVEEMGKISEILAKNIDIEINQAAIEDFIKTLKNAHIVKKNSGEQTNDDFLKQIEELRRIKK